MDARRRSRDEGGEAGIVLVLLVSLLASAQGQEEVEEGNEAASGETSDNASLAKAVEAWLPIVLGMMLLVAVLAWCAVNLIRVAKDGESETVNASKVSGVDALQAYHEDRIRGRTTEDVTPSGNKDTFRYTNRALSGAAAPGGGGAAVHGVLVGNGNRLLENPGTIFNGDDFRGKKAPGEHGDVYLNPLKGRTATTPATASSPSSASGSAAGGMGESTLGRYHVPNSRSGPRSVALSTLSSSSSIRGAASRASMGGGLDYAERGKVALDDDVEDGAGSEVESGVHDGRDGGSNRDRKSRRKGEASSSRAAQGGSSMRPASGRGLGEQREGDPFERWQELEQQESGLRRSLRPAVLRAARPIDRMSSSGVERAAATEAAEKASNRC